MNKIKKLADGHSMNPRPEAWKKLNDKLKVRKSKQRMLTYRNLAVAALVISVLSVTTVFTMYLGKHNPKVFSSNEQYRPVMLEELVEAGNDPYYDVEYVDKLYIDYIKSGF